ncbi:MAG: 30S ribosomal protein S9 [Planctomycetia bacterium]|nr:30S ribosomal protein S9 [Planctomycetia bacterium]
MTTAAKINETLGTGRRKTSVARVRVRPGEGKIVVNGRPLSEFFANEQDRYSVISALELCDRRNAVDIVITVSGGGTTGQSGACRMGIARALKLMDPTLEEPIRKNRLLTRDSRMKERKKFGFRGARRGTQFSKR